MARSTFVRWAIQSLGPTLAMRRSAKAGEIGPKIAVDKDIWRDPYPWYDALRAQGPLVRGEVVHSTASHQVCSEVLRSASFGVGFDASSLPSVARTAFHLSLDRRYP